MKSILKIAVLLMALVVPNLQCHGQEKIKGSLKLSSGIFFHDPKTSTYFGPSGSYSFGSEFNVRNFAIGAYIDHTFPGNYLKKPLFYYYRFVKPEEDVSFKNVTLYLAYTFHREKYFIEPYVGLTVMALDSENTESYIFATLAESFGCYLAKWVTKEKEVYYFLKPNLLITHLNRQYLPMGTISGAVEIGIGSVF